MPAMTFALAFVPLVLLQAAPAGDAVDRCAEAAERGQALRNEYKLRESKRALEACTAPECPAVLRRDCAKYLDDVESAQPTVVFAASDDTGAEMTDGRILVDGAVVAERLDGRAVAVDPGEHAVVYSGRGVQREERLVIREGEKNRLVVFRFGAHERRPEPPPARKTPVAPYVVGGIGLGAVAAGSILWAFGRSSHADMESSCARTQSCSQGEVDAAQRQLVVGDVLVGLGLVTIAAAIYLVVKD